MHKTILRKIIAVVILMAIILPVFGTTVIAVSDEIAISQANLRTSTRFVEANLSLVRGEETFEKIVADVNDKTLNLRLFLNLKDEGYLQSGQIKVRNSENLTFEFISPEKSSDLIQSVESQIIKLNQIKGISETYLEIPIRYIGADNVDSKHLMNKFELELTGEYTNIQGNKYDLYKRSALSLSWVDRKEVEVTNKVEKYIKYEVGKEKGVVLQNLITVSNKQKEIVLPTQKIVIETNLLKIEDKLPKSVNVSVQKAGLMNVEEKIVLDKDIYKWDKENNLLTIEVENAKNADETYSAGKGQLEILVTSIYDVEDITKKYQGDLSLKLKQFVLTGDAKLTEIQKELKTSLVLDKVIGKIVAVDEEMNTKEIAKGLLYVNSKASNAQETIIKSKLKLDVSNIDVVDSLKVVENEPLYDNRNSESNLIYKTIEINKKEFDDVFGEGYIEIYSGTKNIGKIDRNILEVDNKYKFEFKEKHSNITLQTSKPIKEGEVFIEFTRSLGKSKYSISTLKDFKNLELKKNAYVIFNNEQKLLKEIKNTIKLVDAKTKISVSMNKDELSTISKNENVEFILALNNDKLISDVYGQTGIEILLPQGIKEFKLKDANILHGNGLKIQKANVVKYGNQYVLQVYLTGVQDGLSKGYLTNGTNIVLNTDIVLDQWTTSKENKLGITYFNTLSTNYEKPVIWNMTNLFVNFKQYGNGYTEGRIKYVAPKGMVLIDEFSKINKKDEKVISILQGYKEGKLDVLAGKRVVEGKIYLLNNSGSEADKTTILGRVPNRTNKNIFTNQSLGSTFDTSLVRGISSQAKGYRVYYSKNANATNDLRNMNNGWTDSMELKEVKSYLIVLDNNMKVGDLITFNYTLEVPANLEHNQQIQTYSLVEYGINTNKGNTRYYQMASPIGLSTGEGVQLKINVKADKEKVVEHENIIYTIEVKNEAKKTEAKNVESYFRIPDNLEFVGIRDDASRTQPRLSENKKGVFISLGNVKVGSSTTKDIVFKAKKVKNDEPIELTVNTKADNFEAIKTEKALGSSVEGKKLSVLIENVGDSTDNSTVNIYPNIEKLYSITVKNNTGYNYNETTDKVSLGQDLKNVTLKLNLPSTLEYAETDPSALYRVVEYNKITNVLTIQLTESVLPASTETVLLLPLKLRSNLPSSYDRTLKISGTAAAIVDKSNENISVGSNILTNYIAEVSLGASLGVYKFDNYTGAVLTNVEEYQDIFIKYTIRPTSFIAEDHLFLEATEGLLIRGVYKSATYGRQKTGLVIGNVETSGTGKKTYVYPTFVPANQTLNVFVHAQVQGIGESSSKSLNCKIGLVGRTSESSTISLTIHKGKVKNSVMTLLSEGKVDLSPEDMKKFGVGAKGVTATTNSVLGKAWVDESITGIQAVNSKALGNVIVELVDNNTKKVVARTNTDDKGNYQFDNVVNGNYSAVFKYNNNKYMPTAYNAQSLEGENSKGIKVNLEDRGNTAVAVTDGIQVNFSSVKNIDLGLVEKSNFDLSIDSEISEVEVHTENKAIKTLKFNDRKTVKIELDRSALNKSKVLVKYLVQVKNEGEVEGNVLKINAYIPKGMNFVPAYNKMWTQDKEGNVFTTAFSGNEIKIDEIQQIPLILEKEVNGNELGLSVLGLEIAEAKNSLGLTDRDSTPNNKNTEEDDYVNVELILGLNTGKKIAYVLLIITILAVIGTSIFLVTKKINGKEIR